MVRVGIFGGTGYTGHELVKMLNNHAQSELVFATSRRSAGERMSDLYPCPYDVTFVAPEEAAMDQVDVAFCCLPHGESMPVVQEARSSGVRVVDLSADFRLRDVDVYQSWYKKEHVAPALLDKAIYGLTEVYREQIAAADLIANPGCYPTGALLALYPLLGHLGSPRVIIDAKSGVSGAGRKLSLTTHFVEVNESFKPYSVGRSHRHLSEIEQELHAWGATEARVTFSPHLLPVDRGILSTIYVTMEPGWTVERLVETMQTQYAGEPFLHVLLPGQLASLAHVVHTNRCVLSAAAAGVNDFILVAAIDNLLKGASGQALQNMNLMFGLDETMGLPV